MVGMDENIFEQYPLAKETLVKLDKKTAKQLSDMLDSPSGLQAVLDFLYIITHGGYDENVGA